MVFQITNEAMSSSLVINASDANATLHNGLYTCQVTLTVDKEDNFTTTSNIATVGLRGTCKFAYCAIIHTLSTLCGQHQKEKYATPKVKCPFCQCI